MAMTLPRALQDPDDTAALRLLHRYYGGEGVTTPHGGAAFDTWDSTGTRARDADRFTADDVIAVTFLSVTVPPTAARRLLVDDTEQFTQLLRDLGPDRDLVDLDTPLVDDWVGWSLMGALRELPGVGPTVASKLVARKRPRLRPIWDQVVVEVTGTRFRQWEPVRQALRADDCTLHRRLVRLGEKAGLDPAISALRVLDVIAWREGKDRGLRPSDDSIQPGASSVVRAEGVSNN